MLKLDGFANGDDVSGPGSLAGGCCFDFKKASTPLRAPASHTFWSHCALQPPVAVSLRPRRLKALCPAMQAAARLILHKSRLLIGSTSLQHITLPTLSRTCAGPGSPLCGRH